MTSAGKFGVILPAAGSGTRYGGGDKLLVNLGVPGERGKSVLQRTVNLFAHRPDVATIVIVTTPDRFDPYRAHLAENSPLSSDLNARLAFVAGGRERWESVLFGLRHLASSTGKSDMNDTPQFVAVHDAARPLCSTAVIDAAFRGAIECGGSLPCVAEPATLKKRGSDGRVSETIDRRGLFQAQTPQCFLLAKLLEGYESLRAGSRLQDVTDDAQVFERMGWPVKITDGSSLNMKITTAEDVVLANAIARSQ